MALPRRSRLLAEYVPDTIDPRERVLKTAEFIRESRQRFYPDLYGNVLGPERHREVCYLKQIAEDDALVQAFFYFYGFLFDELHSAKTWDVMATLYGIHHGPKGEVIRAELTDEPDVADSPSHPLRPHTIGSSVPLPAKFSWPTYYGAFAVFGELLFFKPIKGLPMDKLRETFWQAGAREEVNEFLDVLIRVRLLEAISTLKAGAMVKDATALDAYLKKLFVAEANNLNAVTSRLGSSQRIRFARIGLFTHGLKQDVRFVRYADRVVHEIVRLSAKWNRLCKVKRPTLSDNPGLGRLRSFIRDAAQAANSTKTGLRSGANEAQKKKGLDRVFFLSLYGKRVMLLTQSIRKKKKKKVNGNIPHAVRTAFVDYLNDFLWGRVPVDAYIHHGFQERGFIYLRAIRLLLSAELDAVDSRINEERQKLVDATAASSVAFRQWQKVLSRDERWVLRLRLQGLTNNKVTELLRPKFSRINTKTASKIWRRLDLALARQIPRGKWKALEQRRRRDRLEVRHRYR